MAKWKWGFIKNMCVSMEKFKINCGFVCGYRKNTASLKVGDDRRKSASLRAGIERKNQRVRRGS